jgi:hypothetical protein
MAHTIGPPDICQGFPCLPPSLREGLQTFAHLTDSPTKKESRCSRAKFDTTKGEGSPLPINIGGRTSKSTAAITGFGAGRGKRHVTQRSRMSEDERSVAEATVVKALVAQRGMSVLDAMRVVAKRIVKLDGRER